jgi:hypothetical protein
VGPPEVEVEVEVDVDVDVDSAPPLLLGSQPGVSDRKKKNVMVCLHCMWAPYPPQTDFQYERTAETSGVMRVTPFG